MKTSQTTNSNRKIVEKIWNLVILTILGINICFIIVTLPYLLLSGTHGTFWYTFCTFSVTIFTTLLLTSKIHEYGHAIAIHYFRPELKVELKLAHTDCNWKEVRDESIPIVAVAGVFTVLVITTIASAIFYFLGFKLIHLAFLTTGNLQFLVNMLDWNSKDGYALFHPHEFKNRIKDSRK